MFGETIWNNIFSIQILNAPIETTFHIYMSVSRNGVYKIYDHMHVAFPRIIPRIMPRIIPANHTTNHTHDFGKGGRNIPETYPRNIPPKHTYALLGTEFSERAIYIYMNVLNRYFTLQVVAIIFQMFQSKAMKTRLENLAFNEGRQFRRGWDQQQIPPWHQGSLNYIAWNYPPGLFHIE